MGIPVKDKVAVVTGANRGIGKAIVESFLAHGARKVYLAVRKADSAAELKQRFGDQVEVVEADLSNTDSIEQLAKAAADAEIVVNNGGVLETADPLAPQAYESLQRELDVNVYGLLRVARAFAPVLKENGGGALVQLNSVASIKNFADFATYSASKAAAYSLTQGLRDKLNPAGTQVLSVHPGPIATDMARQAGFDEADSVNVVSEGIVEALGTGQFHLFPDTMAKQFEAAYQGYAEALINEAA